MFNWITLNPLVVCLQTQRQAANKAHDSPACLYPLCLASISLAITRYSVIIISPTRDTLLLKKELCIHEFK